MSLGLNELKRWHKLLCCLHLLLESGPVFYLWPSKFLANERRRYISNVFCHWLKPCWAIGRIWDLLLEGIFNLYLCVNRACHLLAISGTIILIPIHSCQVTATHLVIDYQLSTGNYNDYNLLIHNLEICCTVFTKWKGTRLMVPVMALRVTYSINFVDQP